MAEKHGHTMNRRDWRMTGLVHVAETREQAIADVAFGLDEWLDYFEDVAVIPMVPPERRSDPITHLVESGRAVIGTPDDCIAQIEQLWESSQGGFGCYLVTDHNWAPFDAKLHSYELIARHVMPHFSGQNRRREASNDHVRGKQKEYKAAHQKATAEHIERHRRELEKSETAS